MHILLALAAGAATVLAYAPFDLFTLVFLGWGTLFWLVRQAESPAAAARLGFAWGFGHFFAGLCWLYVALHRFGGMAPPLAGLAVLLFCAVLALYPALAVWLQVRLHSNRRQLDAIVAAACWTLCEWLRGTLWTGFPWLAIGYTQTPPSPLAGWVPLFGVYGTGFFVAWLSALLAQPGLDQLRRRGAGALHGGRASVAGMARSYAVALGLALAILGAGAGLRKVRWTHPVGAPLSVALLQTNIPQDLKWQPQRLMEWLQLNYELVRRQRAQLVILPESTLPLLDSHLPQGYLEALSDAVAGRGGNVIFGVFTRAGEHIYNSAISRGAEAGQVYSKHHLVPFGEYSPPLFGWFYAWVQIPMSDQTSGAARQPPLVLNGQHIAVNICYEDVFGEGLLHALPRATLLLNLSNLAWYGDSHAQPQHLQIARMRALETGRPMLRATNTGMTAIVQPDGSVSGVLVSFTRGALTGAVRGYQGMTPYAYTGNWPVLLIVALVLGRAAWLRRQRRLEPGSGIARLLAPERRRDRHPCFPGAR